MEPSVEWHGKHNQSTTSTSDMQLALTIQQSVDGNRWKTSLVHWVLNIAIIHIITQPVIRTAHVDRGAVKEACRYRLGSMLRTPYIVFPITLLQAVSNGRTPELGGREAGHAPYQDEQDLNKITQSHAQHIHSVCLHHETSAADYTG